MKQKQVRFRNISKATQPEEVELGLESQPSGPSLTVGYCVTASQLWARCFSVPGEVGTDLFYFSIFVDAGITTERYKYLYPK